MADTDAPSQHYVGRSVLLPKSDLFPPALQEMGVKKLHCVGDTNLLKEPLLAVVGSSRPTPYGIACAEICGRVAAECGIAVMTTGFLGCAYSATRCALDSGGKTIIVCGVGADVVFPRTSFDCFQDTRAKGGLIISAEPWGSLPKPEASILRDEIIATLAKVLIVVEAKDRSSAIHTARVAKESGARVYAVPGSIFSAECAGTNCLLQDGVYPIASDKDLHDRICLDFGIELSERQEGPAPMLGQVLKSLAANPMPPEELSQALDVTVLTILRTLIDYEHHGIVQRLVDGRYSLTPVAYERLRTHADKLSLI